MALVAFPATASAETIVMKVPTTYVLTSCTGELVTLTGEQTVIDRTTVDSQGGLHTKFGIEGRGFKGVGASGAKYVGVETFESETNIPRGATEHTDGSNFSLVRQGDTGTLVLGDDMRIKALFHFTFNSLGVLTSFKDEYRADCT